MASENLKRRITVRLNEEEYRFIEEVIKKTGKNKSACVRQIINGLMNKKDVLFETKEHYILSRKLINEINHIVVNINQIVKNNNSRLYSKLDKDELFRLMNRILEVLQQGEGNGNN